MFSITRYKAQSVDGFRWQVHCKTCVGECWPWECRRFRTLIEALSYRFSKPYQWNNTYWIKNKLV